MLAICAEMTTCSLCLYVVRRSDFALAPSKRLPEIQFLYYASILYEHTQFIVSACVFERNYYYIVNVQR